MKIINVLEHRLGGERHKGTNGTKKGIVQKYTAIAQQIGRTFKDKGERVEGGWDKDQ